MKTFLIIFSIFFITGCKNLHEVHKAKLYRSAQLNEKEFSKVIDKLKIKTVINLRGASPQRDWWIEEARVMAEKGVEHINIRMSAKRFPHRKDLIKLLDAFKHAPRPILMHCQGGADRTGEASAIYKILYQGKSKKKALKQLRPRFGHIKLRFPAKRKFIKDIWVDENWARNTYDPCLNDYGKYYKQQEHCDNNNDPELTIDEDS